MQNAELIYQRSNHAERLADSESLYIVTGCIKSDSWAMAAFREPGNAPHETMRLEDVSRGRDEQPRYVWTNRGSWDARSGSSNQLGLKNQTLFIRCWKLDSPETLRSRTAGSSRYIPTGSGGFFSLTDRGDESEGCHHRHRRGQFLALADAVDPVTGKGFLTAPKHQDRSLGEIEAGARAAK